MKPFTSPFPSPIFFLYLYLFLFPLLSIPGFTTQNLIQETCRTCSEGDPNIAYDFCTASLQAAPDSQNATLQGLGKISIRLISQNITDTRFYIKNLLQAKNLDPSTKGCLGDCLELYSDAIFTMTEAIYYYNTSQYFDANIQISSIMDAAGTCEDGFSEKKGLVSPLTARNNNTFELSAMSLAIMHLLQT